MAYTEIQDFNITGIDGLFLYAAEVVPIFIPLFLFSVFMITLLGTFFSEKRLTGRSDMLSSMAVAGWFTTIIAFILSLTEGLINSYTLSICIAVAVVTSILLLSSGDRIP